MDKLQQQVQATINQARYNLKDGQMNPEDETLLMQMQRDLGEKIETLQGIRGQIAAFKMSVAGHYS